VNLGVAKVKGIELNYQQAFTFLPGLLSGFGTQLNATFIDTSSSDNQPVLGLSKTTYNGILYYERGPFTARIAYNWRSKSAVSFTTTPATGELRPNWYSSDDQVDASIGLKLTKYATLSAAVTNLFYKKSGRTNYNQMIDAVNGYEIADRQFRIGIRGRF
jgi:iron complex outermembrane recepter protein